MMRRFAFVAMFLVAGWILYIFLFTGLGPAAWGISAGSGPMQEGFQPNGKLTVKAVVSGSPAIAAGVVPGDVIAVLAAPSLAANGLGRQRAQFSVQHKGSTRAVTFTAPPYRTVTDWIVFLSELLELAMAFLLALRRWQNIDARLLIVYFVCTAPALSRIPIANEPWFTIEIIFRNLLPWFGFAALIRFAGNYPSDSPASALRRRAGNLAAWVCLSTTAISLICWAIGWPAYDLNYRIAGILWPLYAWALPAVLLAWGAFSRQTVDRDRARIRLLFIFFVSGITGPVIYSVIQLFYAVDYVSSSTYFPLNATLVIVYVGFAYMMLTRGMFDLGFVLNRAAVYAVITAVLVPLFAILEWASERYVINQSRAAGVLIEVGIALVLFLSVRRLHAIAEGFVDTVLFRERHENEMAMRDFARQVLFITEARTIGDRTVQTICERTAAAWSAMYTREDTGKQYVLGPHCGAYVPPPSVSENDAAVVAMRTDHALVEHLRGSAFDEALVLPLFARGRITGFLVCGPKSVNESYAPDERDALSQIARGVAAAFDSLRLVELENENRALRAELAR